MNHTILVVDDDPWTRRLIATTLRDIGGFRIEEAGDGWQALAAAYTLRPAVVFLDYELPGLGGVETCRRLRSEPATADATIIMLTGMADQPAQRRAAQAGADVFLTKPFSPLRLMRMVDELGARATA